MAQRRQSAWLTGDFVDKWRHDGLRDKVAQCIEDAVARRQLIWLRAEAAGQIRTLCSYNDPEVLLIREPTLGAQIDGLCLYKSKINGYKKSEPGTFDNCRDNETMFFTTKICWLLPCRYILYVCCKLVATPFWHQGRCTMLCFASPKSPNSDADKLSRAQLCQIYV